MEDLETVSSADATGELEAIDMRCIIEDCGGKICGGEIVYVRNGEPGYQCKKCKTSYSAKYVLG